MRRLLDFIDISGQRCTVIADSTKNSFCSMLDLLLQENLQVIYLHKPARCQVLEEVRANFGTYFYKAAQYALMHKRLSQTEEVDATESFFVLSKKVAIHELKMLESIALWWHDDFEEYDSKRLGPDMVLVSSDDGVMSMMVLRGVVEPPSDWIVRHLHKKHQVVDMSLDALDRLENIEIPSLMGKDQATLCEVFGVLADLLMMWKTASWFESPISDYGKMKKT